jgi:hypothetical protein
MLCSSEGDIMLRKWGKKAFLGFGKKKRLAKEAKQKIMAELVQKKDELKDIAVKMHELAQKRTVLENERLSKRQESASLREKVRKENQEYARILAEAEKDDMMLSTKIMMEVRMMRLPNAQEVDRMLETLYKEEQDAIQRHAVSVLSDELKKDIKRSEALDKQVRDLNKQVAKVDEKFIDSAEKREKIEKEIVELLKQASEVGSQAA